MDCLKNPHLSAIYTSTAKLVFRTCQPLCCKASGCASLHQPLPPSQMNKHNNNNKQTKQPNNSHRQLLSFLNEILAPKRCPECPESFAKELNRQTNIISKLCGKNPLKFIFNDLLSLPPSLFPLPLPPPSQNLRTIGPFITTSTRRIQIFQCTSMTTLFIHCSVGKDHPVSNLSMT